MFVRKIRSNSGIVQVGKSGIDKIYVDGGIAFCYTAGGNILSVRCKKVLDEGRVVGNTKRNKASLLGYVIKRGIGL